MTAYNAGLSMELVGWLAAAAVWSFLRPNHPDAIGLLWITLAVMIACATFPSAPHAGAFWVHLPWHDRAFWETGILSLMGAAGFFGLMEMCVMVLWRHFLFDHTS